MSNPTGATREAAWQALRGGRLQQAAALAGELVGHDERDHDALHLLGLVAHLAGQYPLAERMLERACALAPEMADYHNNLATVRVAQGRREAAIEPYRRAALLGGPSADAAQFNLVLTLLQCGRPAEALAQIEVLAQRGPLTAAAWDAQGSAYYGLSRYPEALAAARRAVAADPGTVAFRFNLGNALYANGAWAEAEAAFRSVLAAAPDYPEAHVARANALLITGVLPQGWAEMDWHWRQAKSMSGLRPFPHYEWRGQDLAGKTLLVWMEQGVGDEIEQSTMLGEVVAQAGQVLIECDPRLVPLLARSLPRAAVFARQDPPHPRLLQKDVDFQINAGSLAASLRADVASFPAEACALAADPAAVARWRARLAGLGGRLSVGFSWRSKLVSTWRNFHYSSLDEWAALFALPDITWVNLQYDDCAAELDAAEQRFGIKLHRFPELDLMNDLDGAAALTTALDLVIAPANSVLMMAGALGVPTWMATYAAMNWHMLGTDRQPFLPSVRIFARGVADSWSDVFGRMAGTLAGASHLARDERLPCSTMLRS